MGRRQLSHEEYTIGWVCALSLEQTAAIHMLDEKHKSLHNSKHDHNAYTLGRIGKHNVVIAGLPFGRADNNNAATLAAQMLSTFPNIRMTLMVGVGGGLPQKTRLGDVVICCPSDTNAGVIQWDKGKEEANGFRRQGCLNGPPRAALTALASFQADPENSQTMSDYLGGIAKGFFTSEYLDDILFDADHDHVGDATDCRGCDKNRMQRRGLSGAYIYPKVHYGLIASGNKKIKDAKLRDKLFKDYNNNLYCIEMEAAGLMDDFHCVVIRGICDYADSHANDTWQSYAAAVAAACAKTYLGVLQEYENNVPQSVQDSFVSDDAIHLRENGNSRKNHMRYSITDSSPLTCEELEGTTAFASRMIEWPDASHGNNLPGMAQSKLGQKQATEEKIRDNHGQPEDVIRVRRTNSDLLPTQPIFHPSMIKKEDRVSTFPNTDPAVFFDAIDKGDIATIKREIKNGTKLEIFDEFGRTPLWRAVDLDKRSIIQLLLENGANVEATNFRGQNILDWALTKGKQDIVNMVIAIGDAE